MSSNIAYSDGTQEKHAVKLVQAILEMENNSNEQMKTNEDGRVTQCELMVLDRRYQANQ